MKARVAAGYLLRAFEEPPAEPFSLETVAALMLMPPDPTEHESAMLVFEMDHWLAFVTQIEQTAMMVRVTRLKRN